MGHDVVMNIFRPISDTLKPLVRNTHWEKQLLIYSYSTLPQKLGLVHHRHIHTQCGDQQKTLGASTPAGVQGPLQKENHGKMMPFKRKLKTTS